MGLFNFFKRSPKRLENITVYYLSEIVDGMAYSSPLGYMPRFSDDYETSIKQKHQPKPEFGNCTYINEILDGKTVILFWQNDRIEAISFLAEKEARALSELKLFPAKDLAILDKALKHFPRKNF
ncbi:MAG: hypothetical protein J0L77_01435 [Alphaproteobacteria bacterium]|nr:hypothetical protein [Alphaproteobacteria bacterium]